MATVSNFSVSRKAVWNDTGANVALDSLPFAAALLDSDGVVRQANRMWNAAHCEERYKSAGIQRGVSEVLEGCSASFSQECEDASGRYRITVTPHRLGALVIQQLLDSSPTPRVEKMAALGRLVGGVAHDFANLLTLIGGYSELLIARVGQQDPLRAELEEIRKAVDRGTRLTNQLLGFTRGQPVHARPLDLNAVIADVRRMLEPIIGEYVELRVESDPHLSLLMADIGQMEQVIINLILNARDAMPEGGRITVKTANCELDEKTARLHGMEPGSSVMLSITDTGHGMDPAILEHIWEPFFTTKEKGKGTGFGLHTVRRIIRESGGDVWVENSVPGEGTTFTICLRSAPTSAERPATQASATPVKAGHETVLLVEDEDSVRMLLRHVLCYQGYQVLEASNGEEAVDIFEKHSSEIQLVLTDMVMPKMSGRELAARLTRMRPDTKIIFMSGHTDDVLIRTGALGPGMSFLQKPLRPDALAAKVREALDCTEQPLNAR